MALVIARSTDYAAIRALLTEPRCWRLMGHVLGELAAFEVGPREGITYVTASEGAELLAVFLVTAAWEVHFCFAPAAWGHTQLIARSFLDWVWRNTNATHLIGPGPRRNRLAVKLARAVGFAENREKPNDPGSLLLQLQIERPT